MNTSFSLLAMCSVTALTLMLASCGKNAVITTKSPNANTTAQLTNSTTSSPSSAAGIRVVATIKVDNGALSLAYNPSRGELLVVNGNNALPQSVISDATNIAAPGVAGNGAMLIAYDSGKNEFFETRNSFYNGWVISGDTNAKIADMIVPEEGVYLPSGICYDSGKGEVFIANSGANNVVVVSDKTNAQIAKVAVGKSPQGIAYDSGKGEIFVANSGDSTVSVISDGSNQVVATIALPADSYPTAVAYDSAKGEIFIANSRSSTITVISDSNNKVVATITLPPSSLPSALAYDSGKGEIFVANPGQRTAPGTVSVISDITHTIIATIPVGTSPVALAYDSGKGEVFVCNSADKTVSVITRSSP